MENKRTVKGASDQCRVTHTGRSLTSAAVEKTQQETIWALTEMMKKKGPLLITTCFSQLQDSIMEVAEGQVSTERLKQIKLHREIFQTL